MKIPTDSTDEDFGASIREAFTAQPIPERPNDLQTLEMIRTTNVVSSPWGSNRLWQGLAAIPVVVVFLMLGNVFLHPEQQQEKLAEQTTTDPDPVVPAPGDNIEVAQQDSERDALEINTSQTEQKAEPKDTEVEPETPPSVPMPPANAPIPQPAPPQRLESNLMLALRRLNESWTSKQNDASGLVQHLNRLTDDKSVSLAPAFEAMGVPRSVKSTQMMDASSADWWRGTDEAALGLELDLAKVFVDAQKFVDVALGDTIFEEILDGIHQDPEGPRIDVRALVPACLDGKVHLVIDRYGSPNATQSFLFVVSLKDTRRFISEFLDPTFAKEPTMTIESVNGIWMRGFGENTAACVVHNQFLIGSRDKVEAALRRRQPSSSPRK